MLTIPTTTATRDSSDYPWWFLDYDGTIRHGRDELGRFVNGPDDVVVFDEVPGLLQAHVAGGGINIGMTNQAGVALGHMTAEQCAAGLAETRRQCSMVNVLEAGPEVFFATVACVHHPDAGCWCRKPLPGGIHSVVQSAWTDHGVDVGRSDCLMIGDRPEDAEAAARAGIDFRLASEWRAGR